MTPTTTRGGGRRTSFYAASWILQRHDDIVIERQRTNKDFDVQRSINNQRRIVRSDAVQIDDIIDLARAVRVEHVIDGRRAVDVQRRVATGADGHRDLDTAQFHTAAVGDHQLGLVGRLGQVQLTVPQGRRVIALERRILTSYYDSESLWGGMELTESERKTVAEKKQQQQTTRIVIFEGTSACLQWNQFTGSFTERLRYAKKQVRRHNFTASITLPQIRISRLLKTV